MIQFFKRFFGLFTYGYAAVFLLSCFSFCISPATFSPIALLGLGFPYLFLGMLFFIVVNLYRNKWVALILFIILLPGLYNFSHVFAFNPKSFQDQKEKGALRVITWNVEAFGKHDLPQEENSEGILQTIQAYNPDVVCLEECPHHIKTYKAWENICKVMDSLGYKGTYHVSDSALWEGKMIDFNTGVGLFTKDSLSNKFTKRILDQSNHFQNYISADMIYNHKPVRLKVGRLSSFNLYADTAHQDKNIYEITMDRKRMVQHQLRSIEKLHQEQIQIIRKDIDASPYPVVYCGDMNSVPTSYNYYLIRGKNLQDGFQKGGWGIGATFYNIVPTLRIDLCLSDYSFKVLQSKVIKVTYSDHYPLITDMIWK